MQVVTIKNTAPSTERDNGQRMQFTSGDISVLMADATTTIRKGDASFSIPTDMMLDPRASTDTLSFAAQSRLFSKFTTLVRQEVDSTTQHTLRHTLELPKDVFSMIKDLIKAANDKHQAVSTITEAANETAEEVQALIHHPKGALYDTHTEKGSQWAARKGPLFALATLDAGTGQLSYATHSSEDYDGSIRNQDFVRWLEKQPICRFDVPDAANSKMSGISELAVNLAAKRKMAMKPINTDLAGMP